MNDLFCHSFAALEDRSERNEVKRRISVMPILTEVRPTGIGCSYQLNFLFPQPTLYSFLSGNGRIDITKGFKIKQLVDVIFFCKALNQLILMVTNPFLDVVGHSDIKRARFIGHNVNVVLIICVHVFHLNKTITRCPDPSLRSG